MNIYSIIFLAGLLEITLSNSKQNIGALDGVRILDMATVLAAPFGVSLCADHGADVVKLELPDGSDALRGLHPIKDGKSLWWKIANRGKKGITLDVREPEGRKLFLKFISDFDVLVENFRPGTLARWGLDTETLHAKNPKLTIIRLTGFGQTGPYSNRPGYARIFEAMSGFSNLIGEQDGPPLHADFPIGDSVAGIFTALSISMEMVRMRSNPDALGREVDLSAMEALFRLLEPLPAEYEHLGTVRTPSGSRATYTAPSNMYKSADGIYFSLVASSNAIFKRLCTAVGKPQWAHDPKFNTNPARVRNVEALDSYLSQWFIQYPFIEIERKLEPAGVPFCKVNTIKDVLSDPHFKARNAIVQLPDSDYGSLSAPCIVPRTVGHDLPVPVTGPNVGEHNKEFYGALGIDTHTFELLKKKQII